MTTAVDTGMLEKFVARAKAATYVGDGTPQDGVPAYELRYLGGTVWE